MEDIGSNSSVFVLPCCVSPCWLDLVYLPQPLVLVLGMEEQRLLQKVDNMVSQIRMPWGDKKAPLPRPLPLGTIRILKGQ